jgi:hypothetical protein
LHSRNRWSIQQIVSDPSASIAYAAIFDDLIAVALNSGPSFRIAIVRLQDGTIRSEASFEVEGEVTCLALGKTGYGTLLVAGVWQGNSPCLVLQHLSASQKAEQPSEWVLKVNEGKQVD